VHPSAWGSFDRLEREHVGCGEIRHMDIVADTGAVRRGVVVAKDVNGRTLAGRGLQHERDEMGLLRMTLAARGGRAGGIEIPQADPSQAIGAFVPREGLLERELARPVRIRRGIQIVFLHWNLHRLTEDRAGAGKYEIPNLRLMHGTQQRQAGLHVLLVVLRGIGHRFADQRGSGHVDDRLDPMLPKCVRHRLAIQHVAEHESGPLVDRIPVTGREIVIDDYVMAVIDQRLGHHASDVPGPACHQHLHGLRTSLWMVKRAAITRMLPRVCRSMVCAKISNGLFVEHPLADIDSRLSYSPPVSAWIADIFLPKSGDFYDESADHRRSGVRGQPFGRAAYWTGSRCRGAR